MHQINVGIKKIGQLHMHQINVGIHCNSRGWLALGTSQPHMAVYSNITCSIM